MARNLWGSGSQVLRRVTSTRLSEEEYQTVEEIAEQEGVTVSVALRALVLEGLGSWRSRSAHAAPMPRAHPRPGIGER